MSQHLDFAKFYISTASEVEPGGDYVGYNLHVARLEGDDLTLGCDECGRDGAEYRLTADDDPNPTTACQDCMVGHWDAAHQPGGESYDVFHLTA